MMYKAFVSSTREDLQDHRAYVIRALRKAGFSVDPMEDWTAATDEPKRFSQARVKGCDLCILLVGFRRGHVPEGEELSITQREYRAAMALGLDVLVFMLDEQAPWSRRFDELDKDPGIRRWRAELMERRGVGFFSLKPESIEIASALTRWLAEQVIYQKDAEKKARSFSVSVRTGATQIQSSQFFTKEDLAYYLWWDVSLSPYVEHDDLQQFKAFFEKTAPGHTEFVHAVEEIRPFLPRLDLPGIPTYYPSKMGIERIDLKTNILVANSGHAPMRIKLPQECTGEIADRRVNLPPGWKCAYGLVMEGSNIQIDPKKDHLISASCWLKVSAPDTVMDRLGDWGKYGFGRVRAFRNFVQFLRTGRVSCGPCVIHLLDGRSVRFTLRFNLASKLRSIRLAEVEVDRLEKQWKIVTDEYYKYVIKLERSLREEA